MDSKASKKNVAQMYNNQIWQQAYYWKPVAHTSQTSGKSKLLLTHRYLLQNLPKIRNSEKEKSESIAMENPGVVIVQSSLQWQPGKKA